MPPDKATVGETREEQASGQNRRAAETESGSVPSRLRPEGPDMAR